MQNIRGCNCCTNQISTNPKKKTSNFQKHAIMEIEFGNTMILVNAKCACKNTTSTKHQKCFHSFELRSRVTEGSMGEEGDSAKPDNDRHAASQLLPTGTSFATCGAGADNAVAVRTK